MKTSAEFFASTWCWKRRALRSCGAAHGSDLVLPWKMPNVLLDQFLSLIERGPGVAGSQVGHIRWGNFLSVPAPAGWPRLLAIGVAQPHEVVYDHPRPLAYGTLIGKQSVSLSGRCLSGTPLGYRFLSDSIAFSTFPHLGNQPAKTRSQVSLQHDRIEMQDNRTG